MSRSLSGPGDVKPAPRRTAGAKIPRPVSSMGAVAAGEFWRCRAALALLEVGRNRAITEERTEHGR